VSPGILVDTHILLWARAAPERLTAGERREIDAAPLRFVSAVTLWDLEF
jgi:PIN domain nuclease of toxin-antitoxin system